MKIKVINGEPYGSPMDFGSRQVDATVWKEYITVEHDPQDLSMIMQEQYDAAGDVVRQVLVANQNYSDFLEQEARTSRNNKLAECDWTQLPDSPLSTSEKAEWSSYRQSLRDVPEQSGFPDDITWPTEPS